MPRFSAGDPQVKFRRRDGRAFVKTFHSRSAAARAIVGYRRAGGKILASRLYQMTHRNVSYKRGKRGRKVRSRWGKGYSSYR